MKKILIAAAAISISATAAAEPIVVNSGNVIGPTLHGNMPHHLLQSQHDFARLVAIETNGEIDLRIADGKRPDIPVFAMPKMAKEGTKIQATAVPSFFLPMVPGFKVFEIPYLFRDKDHAAKYPTSELALILSAQIEDRYQLKVLGHFLVAHNISITSTDKPIIAPEDFAGRHINDGFESFGPMWVNIKPAKRYNISFTESVDGGLHKEKLLDTSVGMLQNNVIQKQYTKFNYATVAPSFYTFFYTFMINKDVWAGFSDEQKAGVMRAAEAVQVSAFDNEKATAIYHTALNRALGVEMRRQTADERAAWQKEFSNKVRDGILENSDIADELRDYITIIQGL